VQTHYRMVGGLDYGLDYLGPGHSGCCPLSLREVCGSADKAVSNPLQGRGLLADPREHHSASRKIFLFAFLSYELKGQGSKARKNKKNNPKKTKKK